MMEYNDMYVRRAWCWFLLRSAILNYDDCRAAGYLILLIAFYSPPSDEIDSWNPEGELGEWMATGR